MPDTLRDMVLSLRRVFPNGPSWPFRTQSARTVWNAADRIFTENPDLPAYQVLLQAFKDAGISSAEFTPEDFSILSLAVRWKESVSAPKKKKDRPSMPPQLAGQLVRSSDNSLPAPPAPYPSTSPVK